MSYRDRHKLLAIKLARNSQSSFKIGAVVARSSKVIAGSYNNMRKTHPLTTRFSQRPIGIHAEMAACIRAGNVAGADIYIARVSKGTDEVRLAKPCICCQALLKMLEIKNIYFSTSDGKFEKMEII